MNKWIPAAPLAALLLAACDGDDNDSTNDAAGTLVVTRTLDKGDATCAGGGTVAETGVDANRIAPWKRRRSRAASISSV